MRVALATLKLAAAFGLFLFAFGSTASAQPLFTPASGPGSFGPGYYTQTSSPATPALNTPASFNPGGGPGLLPGVANFRDSAIARGPNGYQDQHYRGLYVDGQPYLPNKGYQSVHDLMTQPRTSYRAPYQYLPSPTR